MRIYSYKQYYSLNLILWIAICLPMILVGQSVDSLERLLYKKELSMQEKVQIYNILSHRYANNEVNRSLYFGKKGVVLARQNKDEKMEATFYKNMGEAYYRAGIYDSAMFCLDKARSMADQLEKVPRLQSSIYNIYANIYHAQSLHEKALENYFAAVKVLEEYDDIEPLIRLYFNIGGIYQGMKNFEQALKYHRMAEELAIQKNDIVGLAYIYVSLSDISVHQGQSKEISVDYARKAVEIFKKVDDKRAGSIAMQALAQAYYHHGDYGAAEPIVRQAVIQAKETGNPNLIAQTLATLSDLYINQGKYVQSVEMALESLKADSADINITTHVYGNLAQANAYLGHPDLTKKYMINYQETMDRYANESYQKSLSGMEVKYETEKKELKIEALEKQRQLYIWLGIAGATILLIALAFALIRYRLAVSRRKLAEEGSQRLEQEKQLVAVQATLDGEAAERTRLAKDLHDGLGSMLSLVKFNLPQVKAGEAAVLEGIDVNRFQKALGMLDDSIRELRRVAHHMMPESLLRYGLKASLSDFCSAIPIADFHYFGDEARLSEKLEIMIYRCIHELVNNALKHAQAKHINVQLVQEQDRISFTVQDDGVGFDQEQVVEGMGLQNVRQRVAAFGGEMNIYSTEQGTEIHVEMEC